MIFPRENPIKLDGGKLQHKLFMDELADFSYLPNLDRAAPGSDVYCIETADIYILNSKGSWEVQ